MLNAWCYSDITDQMVDYLGGSSIDQSMRLIRRAIQVAYMRIVNERSWQYLYTQGRVNFVAPYTTGTVTYNAASNALILSGGTFPSWAANGRIAISGQTDNGQGTVIYQVATNPAPNMLTLDSTTKPTDDISTAADYILFRSVYPLPRDFRRLAEPTTTSTWWSRYVAPKDWLWMEQHVQASGDPVRWTIAQAQGSYGFYSVYVEPYPSQNDVFDFIYQRKPRELSLNGYETNSRVGTVSASPGDANVIGVGTAFSANMVGAILRFGSTTNVPDGLGGLYPYVEQGTIAEVHSTTHLTLASAVTNTFSAVKYSVSDPIDLPDSMWDAFSRCCELEYAIAGRKSHIEENIGLYKQALIKAYEADCVTEVSRKWPTMVRPTGLYHRPANRTN